MAGSCAGQVAFGAAGRWLVQRPACLRGPCGRQLSQGGKQADARSLYRDLLRAVRAFPAEPMLDLNDSGGEQSFAVVASIQIRCAWGDGRTGRRAFCRVRCGVLGLGCGDVTRTRTHRSSFKEHSGADAVAAGKLIAAGQKELKALRALLGNEHIKRHPGPPVCPRRLHSRPLCCMPAASLPVLPSLLRLIC